MPGIVWIGPFLQVTQNRAVSRVGALLNQIPDDVGSSSIGQIDFVAVSPVFPGDAIVEDVIDRCARLQQMTDVGVVGIVKSEQQRGAIPDIEVVCKPVTLGEGLVADSIMSELRV